MDYLFHIIILASIYCLLATALDLVAGQTGLLSLCQAAFFGFGAYAAAICSRQTGLPAAISVPVGMLLTGLLSLLISMPIMHLKSDLFAIATFGFQLILSSIAVNWTQATGGPAGIGNIRPLFSASGDRNPSISLLGLFYVAITISVVFLYRRVTQSPYGRVLRAIKGDEVFVLASGRDTRSAKIQAFFFSAIIAGLAGGLFAHYITYVSPSSFTIMDSVLILSMLIIGGAGTVWGPAVGASLLIILPECLRFLGLSGNAAANIRQILFGLALIVMVLFRPQGLLGYPNGMDKGRWGSV